MSSSTETKSFAKPGVLSKLTDSLLHFIFPHICAGCGTDVIDPHQIICIHCHDALPQTSFHLHGNNPVERIFWGRIPVTFATAQYYFTKDSLVERLMYHFKYRGNKELGLFLGKLMGHQLKESNRFSYLDALVPLPLFPSKERKRGYNQAAILCDGISEILEIPVLKNAVIRTTYTDSQTKKSRVERWQNMEGRFQLNDETSIREKHLLLVDDVITTGATLEACGQELLKGEDTKLSIATFCYRSN
jgi:ComF family protein